MNTEDAITPEEVAQLAQTRSQAYGFLGSMYTERPNPEFVRRLLDSGMSALLGGMSSGEVSGEIQAGLELVRSYLERIREMSPGDIETELAVERTRLLRGIKPGYGPPPAYESVYAGSDQEPLMQAAVAVARAYAEAGVGLPEEVRDQPDFIGFELDFMRHLAQREARAWGVGKRAEARRILEQERAFVEDHLARWVPRFCELACAEARIDFYRGIARLTKGFVEDETERVCDLLQWAGGEGENRRS